MRMSRVLTDAKGSVLAAWMDVMARDDEMRATLERTDVRAHATQLLDAIDTALRDADDLRLDGRAWRPVREYLVELSASLVRQNLSAVQTAKVLFALKRPLFAALRAGADDPATLNEELEAASEFVDAMGLLTIASFQRTREDVIRRQQEDMLELSTPVVKLWDGILALPMIGTLDSARTQVVMETLLQRIVETGSPIAILDITGVPTVDTLVAQHLLKTVTAIRLMGGDCIVSGVRPQIAQTIVHLGVDLGGITTKATLADAFALALKRTGQSVVRVAAPVVS